MSIVESSSNFQIFSNPLIKEKMENYSEEFKSSALILMEKFEIVNVVWIVSLPFILIGYVCYKKQLKMKREIPKKI